MTNNSECRTLNEDIQNVSKRILEDSENDGLLAEMLQREFNRDYEELNSRQIKFDGNSQGYVCKLEDDGEDDVDTYESDEWDKFDDIEQRLFPLSPRGYKSESKHSVLLNKSKNGYKLLTFPPAFQMIHRGKCKNFKNFDGLSKHQKSNRKENHSVEPIPTFCKSKMDSYGCFVIKRFIYNQLLKRVNDVVNIGHSSNVFHADCNPLYPIKDFPKTCAVKVFKNVVFGGGYEYGTSKESLQLWGQREMMGLKKLGGIVNCPKLVSHKQHIVVMSFIGKNYQPAPKIKDVKFDTKEYIALYNEIIDAMKRMYKKGNLIHGCLSENSILWHKQKCYFINFKQCLEPHEENAYNLLYMDCKNIINFFSERNVPNILTADGLFQYITGCSYILEKVELLKLMETEQRKHSEK